MSGKPTGNIRIGRKFTEVEKDDPKFLNEIAHLPMCGSDHSIQVYFGGFCDECGKTWTLTDMRSQ
jgi:hypothetical protein